MKNLFAFLICLACSGCAHVSVTPAIEGMVRDADTNAAISGAKITLSHYQRKDWTYDASSQADGSFRLSPVKIWTPVPFSAIRVIGKIEVQKEGYESIIQTFSDASALDLKMKKKEPN